MVGAGGDGIVTMGDVLCAGGRARRPQRPEDRGLRPADPGRRVLLRRPPQRGPDLRIRATSWTSSSSSAGPTSAVSRARCTPAKNAVVLFDEADPVARTPEDLGLGADAGSGSSYRSGSCPPIRARKGPRTSSASASSRLSSACPSRHASPRDRLPLRQEESGRRRRRPEGVRSRLRSSARRSPRCRSASSASTPGPVKLLMSGNEATAIGALHAGCRFFAGLPDHALLRDPPRSSTSGCRRWAARSSRRRTSSPRSAPSSARLSRAQKAMTATSGPGLSLMTEMLGLASMAEMPLCHRERAARRPVHRPSHEERAVGPLPGGLRAGTATRRASSWPPRTWRTASTRRSTPSTSPRSTRSPSSSSPTSSSRSGGRRFDPASLVHDVRDRRLPSAEELADYHRYRETADGVSPMARPGHQGRDLPDERPRARRSGPPRLGLSPPREDERQALPQAPPHPRRLHASTGATARRTPTSASSAGARRRGSCARPCSRANARGQKVAAFVPQMIYPFPKKELEAFLKGAEAASSSSSSRTRRSSTSTSAPSSTCPPSARTSSRGRAART